MPCLRSNLPCRSIGLLLILVAPILASASDKETVVIPRKKLPEAVRFGAVLKGKGLLTRDVFVEEKALGIVTDIRLGSFNKGASAEIGIAGTRGAVFADRSGKVNSRLPFKRHGAHVDIIDVEGDGVCEFLDRGGHGRWDAALIGHDGAAVWTQGGEVFDMAAGDLDSDGILDFVVGFAGSPGIHRLDRNGKPVWKEPEGNVWSVEIPFELKGRSRKIVHTNVRGLVNVRTANGIPSTEAEVPDFLSAFTLCRWPEKEDPQSLLISHNGVIWIADFEGTLKARLEAPHCRRTGRAYGIPVKLFSHERAWLAVVVEFRHWDRSLLYLYDPDQKLAYQEVLTERCPSIAALALDDSGVESILLGGNGRVLRYRPSDLARLNGAK